MEGGESMEEWQLSDKDVELVTDNASNMIVAAEFGKFPYVKCFAHTLNLASQRALKVATLSRLLGRVRRIATFFHRSTTANHYLKEKQKCLGLKNHKVITDVATRWNSAYDMVERFLEQQPAICATLLSPEAEPALCCYAGDWNYQRHFSQRFEVGKHFSQGSDQKSARLSKRGISRSCKHSLNWEEIPQHALLLHQWRSCITL
ncbi:hypothetical protein KUCAC02_016477 [Chaenocephalus aceratus]|nr:hypothetical protein KUCAC02_016477 [Chaenocephalus aceratus]